MGYTPLLAMKSPSLLLTICVVLVTTHQISSSLAIERVSTDTVGGEANDDSSAPDVSADGRYVVFGSRASDLVADDTNANWDIFVKDRATGAIERVNTSSTGEQANDGAFEPAISANGRYVAFYSYATNLVPGDNNGTADVFLKDRQTGAIELISKKSDGTQGNKFSQAPALSPDARFVAFSGQSTNFAPTATSGNHKIFLKDRQTGGIVHISVDSSGVELNGSAYNPSVSADGNRVVFVLEDFTNGVEDHVYVRDRSAGTTSIVSADSAGTPGNASSNTGPAKITPNGRFVVFSSNASNLVAGDTNFSADVFLRDLQTMETSRVSLDSSGGQANGSSHDPSISDDGRIAGFASSATNLVAGDSNNARDIFLRDLQTGETRRISVSDTQAEADAYSSEAEIAGGGGGAVFYSEASNLVANDLNSRVDIFATFGPISFQPDNLIGTKRNRQRGGNRYNLSGAGQSVSAVSLRGRPVTLFLTVQNDGDVADVFRTGGLRRDRNFAVRVTQSAPLRRNATGGFARTRHLTPSLAPGRSASFLLRIDPRNGIRRLKRFRILSSSLNNLSKRDAAKGTVSARP